MIKRSTLRAQIATALRDEILAARLPAGSGFTVKEIAEQYGVSATPVREALVDLAAQGLLDVEQHRGFRVHEFTEDDYRAMVESRTLVLDGLFQRAGEKGDGAPARDIPGDAPGDTADADADADDPGPGSVFPLDPKVLASVHRRAEAADRAARAGDLDVLIGYDLRYWRELGALVGNPYICDFLERLRVQCWVFAVPGLRRERTMSSKLWKQHSDLVDAVEGWDVGAARRLVAAYHRHSLLIVSKSEAVRLLP